VDPAGLTRLATYVGKAPPAHSWDDAVRTVRATYEFALPGLTDEQWLDYTRRSYTDVNGVPRLDLDPNIGEAVRAAPAAAAPDLWPVFDTLRSIPTLVLRGASSDLLSAPTARQMAARGPHPRIVEFAGIGHAPMLLTDDQIAPVVAFLAE